ncbi:hypothetical protein V494_07325 [Pseudogymnoascus sp. VKM F-4513 (FW-928)]|nr:hypothetical protein V494_07325 [Pseudogymnoascus sp. VKM F-4513 (FW-928)]
MPPALLSHAPISAPTTLTTTTPLNKPQEMGARGERGTRDAAVCPTDDEAVTPRKQTNKQSLDYLWRSGLAGGMAGCAAKSLVAPLDRVKILFQSSNPQFARYAGSWAGVFAAMGAIHRDEGIVGLYRGHSATILRIFPYAAIKFLAYEQIRSVIIHSREQETPLRRLLSGSLAGVTSVFFTYPLEVIRVRLAFETRKDHRTGFVNTVKTIYGEQPAARKSVPSVTSTSAPVATVQAAEKVAVETIHKVAPKGGLINFYRGFSPTMLGMLPYAGMSFLTHDTAGDLLRHHSIAKYTTYARPAGYPEGKPDPLKSWAELFAGGIAGMVSQTSSYPLEVIRRRMQVGGAVGDGRRLRIGETAGIIFKEKGWRGFWVGLSIGYVKVVPMVAVSFFVYERGKTWLGI